MFVKISNTSCLKETFNHDFTLHFSLFSCPYFRNEVGGEEETLIALTRETGKLWGTEEPGERQRVATHTPRQARGFSLLEQASTHWKAGLCPYNAAPTHLIERTDQGSTYYKNFFYGKGELVKLQRR